MRISHFITSAILILLFTSCTSTWQGRTPTPNLYGEAARQEIDRLTLFSENITTQKNGYRVGHNEERYYSWSSLQPLLYSVGPETTKKVNRINRMKNLNNKIGLASLSLLAAQVFISDQDVKNPVRLLGLIGLTWAIGREGYIRLQMTKVPAQFNQELQQKYFPEISYSINF